MGIYFNGHKFRHVIVRRITMNLWRIDYKQNKEEAHINTQTHTKYEAF